MTEISAMKELKLFSIEVTLCTERFMRYKKLSEKRCRSRRVQMFFKLGVLANFAIFTGKHLCWSLFLIKLQGLFEKFLRKAVKYFRKYSLSQIFCRFLNMSVNVTSAEVVKHTMYSTLKRRGNDLFYVVSTWNARDVFVETQVLGIHGFTISFPFRKLHVFFIKRRNNFE